MHSCCATTSGWSSSKQSCLSSSFANLARCLNAAFLYYYHDYYDYCYYYYYYYYYYCY